MCLWLAVCRNLLGTVVGLTPEEKPVCMGRDPASQLNVSVQASAFLAQKCPGAW